MLDENRLLIEAGGAVVFLRPRDKRPTDARWTQQPTMTWEQVKAHYRQGQNIGIRLGAPSRIAGGYLHGLDLDIRRDDPETIAEAADALEALIGDAELGEVQSGSGGASRHLYFVCPVLLATGPLTHSEDKVTGPDGKPHWRWAIDVGGTGRQFVLPPSIHPITGRAYLWTSEPDWQNPPTLSAEVVERWGLAAAAAVGGQRKRHGVTETPAGMTPLEHELHLLVANRTLGFDREKIESTLDALLATKETRERWLDDRDGWLKVGAALHHEFEGSEEGFETWCAFSQESAKYDAADQRRVWESFRQKAAPFRFASLVYAAKNAAATAAYGLAGEPEGAAGDAGTPAGYDPLAAFYKLEEDAWRRELALDEEGRIKSTMPNLVLLLGHEPRLHHTIGYNQLANTPVYLRPISRPTPLMTDVPVADRVNGDRLNGKHSLQYKLMFESRRAGPAPGFGLRVTAETLKDALAAAAYSNKFHPVVDYLRPLVWDQIERVETLFIRYLGSPDHPYYRQIARIMMTAAVTRVHEPGHKFDFAVIIKGKQGKRKSTFIKTLAKGWFGELHGDLGDRKKMVELMQGKWILELPELSSMARAEVAETKAFISAHVDTCRLSYEPYPADYPRQSIFIGSTNDDTYLKDATGGRRFFPVETLVETIDTEALKHEVDQLWAEATAIYRAMRKVRPVGDLPLYLTNEEAAVEAVQLQEEHRVESPVDIYAAAIEEKLDEITTVSAIEGRSVEGKFDADTRRVRRTRVTTKEALQWLFPENHVVTHAEMITIGLALARIEGWSQGSRQRIPGVGRARPFVRVSATKSDQITGYEVV